MGRLGGHAARDVVRAFRRFGWEVARTTGSHHILRKEGSPFHLSLPYPARRGVSPGLLREPLRVAGIDVEAFLREL